MIFRNVTETVGRTPMVALERIGAEVDAKIYAKLESRNPCGSVKDRVGVALIEDAEAHGGLEPGATLIEPTSGNTGIALAFAAAAKGYELILTMPERISRDRLNLLEFLGAKVVLTPGSLMKKAVDKAQELSAELPGSVILQQFDNPANPEVHRRTTAEEIWEDTRGEVDVFVAGVGTGGTITGVGEVLKKRKKSVHVVAVEPAGAAVLSGRTPTGHYIPGLGAGFIPKVLNRDVIDRIIPVTEETAIRAQLNLARLEGVSAGPSCGAALAAALHLAQKADFRGKTFVVVLPDSGERYVNNPIFHEMVTKVRAG
ncbi:MAG TPA: cysteine synthase A [Polyangiaceae bacterium]|nr:cysteine synthase A [Polyangiaceae bacterium]